VLLWSLSQLRSLSLHNSRRQDPLWNYAGDLTFENPNYSLVTSKMNWRGKEVWIARKWMVHRCRYVISDDDPFCNGNLLQIRSFCSKFGILFSHQIGSNPPPRNNSSLISIKVARFSKIAKIYLHTQATPSILKQQ